MSKARKQDGESEELRAHLEVMEIPRRHFEVLIGLAHTAGVKFGRQNPKDDKATKARQKFAQETLVDLFLERPAASGKVH